MDATEDTICLEKYFFFSSPSLQDQVRFDSRKDRGWSRIYPSSRMIYHHETRRLNRFFPCKRPCSLQNRVTASLLSLSLSSVSVQFSFRCERSVLVPRSKWIPVSYGQPARLMEGSVPNPWISEHRYFRVMFANIGIFIPMNFLFCLVFFSFSFLFSILFFGPDLMIPLLHPTRPSRKYLSCPRSWSCYCFFFFWKFRVNIFRSWEL